MASILIIFTYVRHEFSYDKFNKNADYIFRVERHAVEKNGKDGYSAWQPGPLGPALKSDYSEVEDFTRIYQNESPLLISYKEVMTLINAEGLCWVDTSFLSIFGCEIIKGDNKNALKEPNTLVLTESIAKNYFGEEDPIGKSLIISNDVYRVTAICADAPSNTHFHYKYLLSYSTLKNIPSYNWLNGWRAGGVFLYLKLKPGFNKEDIENKIITTYKKNVSINLNVIKFDQKLRSITDIHLHCEEGVQLERNTDINLVRLIFIVAIFILLISLVNAINLATSKSLERAKEVGVRKVVGGYKAQLIYQFVSEFFFINMIAMIIAIIVFLISPVLVKSIFSSYLFLPIEVLKEGWMWLLIIMLLIVNVLISGLYPAFILSSFKPISVLRGKFVSSSIGTVVKKCLIVFQFVITIALIAGVITISKQLSSMQSKDLGFDIKKIFVIDGSTLDTDSTYSAAFNSFKMELLKCKDINSISVSSDIPGKMPINGLAVSLDGSMENYTPGYLFYCGYSFFDLYGMKLLAGRNFSKSFGSDRDAIIINETVSKGLGFKNHNEAIDKMLYTRRGSYKIIGVIADYNQVSPKLENTPIVIRLYDNILAYISININQANSKTTIETINDLWKKSFPNRPFNYYFLEDFYNQQYSLDIQFGNIMKFFTIITIIIICLGLWALSTHTITVRTKELAIRRVLNASPIDIILLLFRYFFNLILIGMVISLPIAYYIFSRWLDNFAYKISIGWWFFILPVLLIIAITILIIGYGIYKVSNKNIAETIKYE